MLNTIVSVQSVSKSFQDFTAVKNANFTIGKGECFGLLGPNGAGKSTLIRMLYGATSRNQGEIKVLGLDPQTHGRELRQRVGVVTQEDALDEQMTVLENMLLYSTFLGIPEITARTRVAELLQFLSLEQKIDNKILTLSGGMKRRLVFLRALLSEPEFLILDEPTTGLDPAVRQTLWDKVRALKAKGTTVLLTTHYMDEAEVLCDRLVVIDRGDIKIEGNPRALISEHCAGFIAGWPNGERLEAKSLIDLSSKAQERETPPEFIRPSNLEDVFLKITGRELGSDA